MGDKIIIETDSGVPLEIQSYERNGSRSYDRQARGSNRIEASVTVGQGQVQEQVQIEIGLGVLNVESMTILQVTAQQPKWTERKNKFSNYSIWMKIKLYDRHH